MKKRSKFHISICVMICILVIGCSQKEPTNHTNDSQTTLNENNTSGGQGEKSDPPHDKTHEEIPRSDSGKQLYYEQNEPFFLKTAAGSKIWIMVDDIWTEPGADHEAYISEHIEDPTADMNLTFIKLTVQNRGMKKVSYFEVLPSFFGDLFGGKTIDLSYPENDKFSKADDSIGQYIEPEETVELVGASLSRVDDENGGVFVWRDVENPEYPNVVFQTPQDERRDKFGVYDFGETIYALDKSDEQQLNTVIHDVTIADEPSIEKSTNDATFIIIDMDIENTGTQTQKIVEALPTAVIDGRPIEQTMIFDNGKGLVEDPWGDSKIDIEPNETFQGTLYLEVDKNLAPQAQLYYMDNHLLIYPAYAMKLNYNLAGEDIE